MGRHDYFKKHHEELRAAMQAEEVAAGIRERVSALPEYSRDKDLRPIYFGVRSLEARKRLISYYRDFKAYFVDHFYASQIADAEAELAALRRKGFEAPWMFPAFAACGLVWLGYSIGHLAGALAGALVAFFLGMSYISKAKADFEAQILTAQTTIEELRKREAEYKGEVEWEMAFSETEERSGSEDEGDDPPIHWAARNNNPRGIAARLAAGDSVNAPSNDSWGSTPLHRAAASGSVDAVRFLISAGADLRVANKLHSRQPIHYAAEHGHAEIVQALVAAGSPIDSEDRYGMQPIHCAAESGDPQSVQVLLDAGAKIDVPDRAHDNQPIHLAALAGSTETVQLLLKAGADPIAKNKHGATPADMARNAESGFSRFMGVQEKQTST